MGLFSVNKANKVYLTHSEFGHNFEVKGNLVKNFLYIDGQECDFGSGDLEYKSEEIHVVVKINYPMVSLFVNDIQVKHVKVK